MILKTYNRRNADLIRKWITRIFKDLMFSVKISTKLERGEFSGHCFGSYKNDLTVV